MMDSVSNKYGTPLSIRIPKDLLDQLDQFCAEYYLERPDAIRMALKIFLKAHAKNGTLLPNLDVTQDTTPALPTSNKRKTGTEE